MGWTKKDQRSHVPVSIPYEEVTSDRCTCNRCGSDYLRHLEIDVVDGDVLFRTRVRDTGPLWTLIFEALQPFEIYLEELRAEVLPGDFEYEGANVRIRFLEDPVVPVEPEPVAAVEEPAAVTQGEG